MLDKKTEKILRVLNEQIGAKFKVVEKQELMQQLELQKEDFTKVLNLLKEQDFLTVNYQDKDEICLAMTLKAQTYFTGKQAHTEHVHLSTTQLLLLWALAFSGAFLGALLTLLLKK